MNDANLKTDILQIIEAGKLRCRKIEIKILELKINKALETRLYRLEKRLERLEPKN